MPMLRTSSESFPAEKELLKDIPYVLRVEFRDLARETTKIIGKPIACHKCNGFLLSADQVTEDEKIGRHFTCTFCGTLNVIEGEIVVTGDDTDFVIEKPPERTEQTTLSKMEAIAYGVQARFEENTGYSKRVTDATINVARALGVPDTEIERWANHRLTRLARDTERLREIKTLLEKLYGNSLGIKTGTS